MLEGVDWTVVATFSTVVLAMGIVSVALKLASLVDVQVIKNDDNIAKKKFLLLLGEAERRMLVYDDGNDNPHSIYNQTDVIERIKEKLRTTPQLKLDCVFNDDDETLFKKTFLNHDQVSIRLRLRNPKRVHYKIIDGQKGYISRHEHDSVDRDGEWVDASAIWPPLASRWLIFRRYYDDHHRYA